jgi:hypothetical protein
MSALRIFGIADWQLLSIWDIVQAEFESRRAVTGAHWKRKATNRD